MKKIIVSVTNDLVTDQRVHRSCMALIENGYQVVLVGRHLKTSLPLSRPYRTVRMHLLFSKKAVFYAEYNLRLFLKLLFSSADLYYSNDTDTLPANYLAAKLRCKPLFFDAHEMFPEVPELVDRPKVKAFWTRIEDHIFPNLKHCCTVCQSIASIYRERYGIEMHVVRNVPIQNAPIPRSSVHRKEKILLYQGAVNVGRGIEPMLNAMPLLDHCRLVVAGVGDKYEELKQSVHDRGLDEKVEFVGRLPFEELRKLTSQADLGISLLQNLGLNYFYSLPNRIADFAQAGVPVLATDFPEIHRVVSQYGIGTLLPPGVENNPKLLADAIRGALQEWDSKSEEERNEIFGRAGEDLSWNKDKYTLLNVINAIFI